MKLLFDTHALYWYIEGDSQLSIKAQNLVQNRENDVFVSPASFWELAIKISIGKFHLNATYEDFTNLVLDYYDFQLLAILPTHTAKLIDLPFYHKDPFDRLLIAQALVEDMILVSSDSLLDQYGINRFW